MPRIPSSDPDRMVFRSGGGCLMLFGLPFFLAGLGIIATLFLSEPHRPREKETGKPAPAPLVIVMGTVFAALGVGLMFGRAGKVLDRRTDTLTTWWGLLLPLRSKEQRLSAFEQVVLSREVRRSKNGTYTVYPVRLRGKGCPDVTLEEPQNPEQARRVAEEVAKFLGRPFADSSMGELVLRQAAELDESVRDRARRTGERVEVPPPPPGQRCRTRVVADTLCIDIPPLGFRKLHAVPLVVAGAAALLLTFAVILPVARDKRMPADAKAVIIGFVGLFLIGVPVFLSAVFATRRARLRRAVEVSPRELRVITRGILSEKAVTIPCDELEELAIVPARLAQGALSPGGEVILARSDRAMAVFGEGLSSQELAWLRAIIWNVVSA